LIFGWFCGLLDGAGIRLLDQMKKGKKEERRGRRKRRGEGRKREKLTQP
jgi:hypothetical protein